jgi:hypothetical protein
VTPPDVVGGSPGSPGDGSTAGPGTADRTVVADGRPPQAPVGSGNGGPAQPDPFAPPRRRPWYLRSTAIAAAALVVVAAAAVVVDLPTHATTADHVATIATEVQAINTDVHPCTYAVTEAFSLYRRETRGQLSASERARVPGLLRDDQVACSFTDQSVVNLGTLTLPQTAAGQQLSGVVKGILLWETSDGVAAIDDIQALVANSGDAHARADLAKQERLLASDRSLVHRAMASVNAALGGAHVPPPALPRLPTPGSSA